MGPPTTRQDEVVLHRASLRRDPRTSGRDLLAEREDPLGTLMTGGLPLSLTTMVHQETSHPEDLLWIKEDLIWTNEGLPWIKEDLKWTREDLPSTREGLLWTKEAHPWEEEDHQWTIEVLLLTSEGLQWIKEALQWTKEVVLPWTKGALQ